MSPQQVRQTQKLTPIPSGITAAEVGSRLNLLNMTTSFAVITLLAIIVSIPLDMLSNIPGASSEEYSVLWILGFTGLLSLVAVMLSSVLKRQVITMITEYGDSLGALLQVSQEIRDETQGDFLLDRILELSIHITGSKAGFIFLQREDRLVFKAVRGTKSPALRNTEIAADRGIAGWVIRNGVPASVSDVHADRRFDSGLNDKLGFAVTSVLCVPLKNAGRTLGVIELVDKTRGPYSTTDLETVSYLANQAAISLERAQFYEDNRNFEIHVTNILLEAIDRLTPQGQGHSKRVAGYANIMARAIRMTDVSGRRVYVAALLHDIGFIKIPLDRAGNPSFYRKHPELGHDVLKPVNFYAEVSPAILHHHERYDGTGYPAGLRGTDIPLESRILAIAEAFDAMTSETSYRTCGPVDTALRELQAHAGTQFDPYLVEQFTSHFDEVEVVMETVNKTGTTAAHSN